MRDDTGDLRIRRVWATLWAAVTLVIITRAVWTLQLGMAWTPVLLAGFGQLPVFVVLGGLRSGRRRAPLLAVLVAGYAIPFLFCGTQWEWMPWPLAVGALCVFQGRAAWSVFGVLICGAVAVGVLTGNAAAVSATVVKATMYALIIFGLYALAIMVDALHTARADLAQGSVRQEQRRLDNDLRTVVGTELRELRRELTAAIEGPAADRAEHLNVVSATARRMAAEVRGTCGGYRRMPPPAMPIESPAVARRTLAGIYGGVTVTDILLYSIHEYHRPWSTAIAVPWSVAIGFLLLAGVPSGRRLTMTGLLLVTPTVIGAAASDMAVVVGVTQFGFLAGVVLVRGRKPHSQVIAALIFAVFVGVHFAVRLPLALIAVEVSAFVMTTFATCGLLRLAALVKLLHQARADLVHEAVLRERTRIARDLHDLLSYNLAAIALKAELCRRQLALDPVTAEAHLSQLQELARRASAELTSLVDRPVELRLAEELNTARAVLASAGIRVLASIGDLALAREADAALAAVLREAVTNIVRHSDARTCSITVSSPPSGLRLRIVNDGVPVGVPGAVPAASSGSGLLSMAERAEHAGGRLIAGPLADGLYEVVADFPAGSAATFGEQCRTSAA